MDSINNRWLGFELNILRRLKFSTIAIPFAGRPDLDWYLKFWGKEVYTNDLCQSAAWVARAYVENRAEILGHEELDLLLNQANVSQQNLNLEALPPVGPAPRNEALRQYWDEADAVWFDNLRERIERLESTYHQALAISHGLQVGEYLRSFTLRQGVTSELRRPLSHVFRRLCERQRRIIDNGRSNRSFNFDAGDFIRHVRADLMFARFPGPQGLRGWSRDGREWREVWVRRNAVDWNRLVAGQNGRLGDTVHSKHGYLELIGQFLEQARPIPTWVIAHTEDGFLSTGELAEQIRRIRRVETVYHKDFSEVVGGGNSYLLIAR